MVIPTHGRRQQVVCAVESALTQSHAPLEVVVVIDGPDPETVRALQDFRNDRLRWIALEENAGGAEARNTGVRAARGEWVAFLDDDDQWMPEKLAKQMRAATSMRAKYPILSSRLLVRGHDGERALPQRLYRTGGNVAEYLFCRKGMAYGEGMLQTSTLLAKRRLLLEIPFQKGLPRHQDWDWLLRVAGHPGVGIAMLPEALTLMRTAERGENVSQIGDWEISLAWAREARRHLSGKAYSFFIATECVARARQSGAGTGTMVRLLWECVRNGRPCLRQMACFLVFAVVPRGIRRKLRAKWRGATKQGWQAYAQT